MSVRYNNSAHKSFYSTPNPYEKQFGYYRAVKKGPFIFVSGTTAVNPENGELEGKGNAYEQAVAAMKRSIEAVERLGGKLRDVTRVRMIVSVSPP